MKKISKKNSINWVNHRFPAGLSLDVTECRTPDNEFVHYAITLHAAEENDYTDNKGRVTFIVGADGKVKYCHVGKFSSKIKNPYKRTASSMLTPRAMKFLNNNTKEINQLYAKWCKENPENS